MASPESDAPAEGPTSPTGVESSIEFEGGLGPLAVFLVVPTVLFVAVQAVIYP